MTDTFRALCAELDALLNDIASTHPNLSENGVKVINDLSDRARALLAQPVAEGPTDEELLRLAREWNSGFESIELHFAADYARAVLDKWGHQ